jgi:hypothetical protein
MKLNDLKASAYDLLAQIEYLQKELLKINQQIINYKNEDTDTIIDQ